MARKIKVKYILELREAQMSRRSIYKTRGMSQHSVSDVFRIADELGITYADVKDKSEDEVYRLFYPDKHITEVLYKAPDYDQIHGELKKTGVNLKLLWNEYKDHCLINGDLSMGYTKFCEGYSEHILVNSLTNHLKHKPGMVCEVDWSGSTMEILSKSTGEVIKVYLFVATLPYSQYSYVEPCLDMKQNTWIKCNVNMFKYFGGSTVKITCDNLKTGVISHPRDGDVILNEKYEDFGNHYLTAIIPAPVRKPKAKASVEATVGKIATAIIARLRNETFYSLEELKIAVSRKLKEFNDAPFQKREGSRSEVFNQSESKYLKALPATPYEVAELIHGHTVNIDCHVAYKTNRYSVPYKYVGKKVELKVTESLIEIFFKSERIASHRKLPSYSKYNWSTNEEHMPDQFNKGKWDYDRIKKWANSIGLCTSEVIERVFNSVKVKEQGYNSALSILRLSKTYSSERLEAACELALEKLQNPRYRSLKAILSSNQDKIYIEKKEAFKDKEGKKSVVGYIRGPEFYGGGDK